MHSFSSLSQSLIPEIISQSQPEFTFNDAAAIDASHADSTAAEASQQQQQDILSAVYTPEFDEYDVEHEHRVIGMIKTGLAEHFRDKFDKKNRAPVSVVLILDRLLPARKNRNGQRALEVEDIKNMIVKIIREHIDLVGASLMVLVPPDRYDKGFSRGVNELVLDWLGSTSKCPEEFAKDVCRNLSNANTYDASEEYSTCDAMKSALNHAFEKIRDAQREEKEYGCFNTDLKYLQRRFMILVVSGGSNATEENSCDKSCVQIVEECLKKHVEDEVRFAREFLEDDRSHDALKRQLSSSMEMATSDWMSNLFSDARADGLALLDDDTTSEEVKENGSSSSRKRKRDEMEGTNEENDDVPRNDALRNLNAARRVRRVIIPVFTIGVGCYQPWKMLHAFAQASNGQYIWMDDSLHTTTANNVTNTIAGIIDKMAKKLVATDVWISTNNRGKQPYGGCSIDSALCQIPISSACTYEKKEEEDVGETVYYMPYLFSDADDEVLCVHSYELLHQPQTKLRRWTHGEEFQLQNMTLSYFPSRQTVHVLVDNSSGGESVYSTTAAAQARQITESRYYSKMIIDSQRQFDGAEKKSKFQTTYSYDTQNPWYREQTIVPCIRGQLGALQKRVERNTPAGNLDVLACRCRTIAVSALWKILNVLYRADHTHFGEPTGRGDKVVVDFANMIAAVKQQIELSQVSKQQGIYQHTQKIIDMTFWLDQVYHTLFSRGDGWLSLATPDQYDLLYKIVLRAAYYCQYGRNCCYF